MAKYMIGAPGYGSAGRPRTNPLSSAYNA